MESFVVFTDMYTFTAKTVVIREAAVSENRKSHQKLHSILLKLCLTNNNYYLKKTKQNKTSNSLTQTTGALLAQSADRWGYPLGAFCLYYPLN